jgi:hypothetical protein
MSDPERAAWVLVDAIQRDDYQRAEDAALAALGRVRKARAEDIADTGVSEGELVPDGGHSMDDIERRLHECPRCGREFSKRWDMQVHRDNCGNPVCQEDMV